MRKVIIDTDTASDDAVALIMAFMEKDFDILAVTVVAGNVPLDMAVQNALYTRELCDADHIPVYTGLAKPILRELETAQNVHGCDGLGDIGLPLKGRSPAEGHAVDTLIQLINQNPGEIELITLGPLSNIAVALLRDPSIARKVKHCTMMGGSGNHIGNVSPLAEFNIWADPEAAKVVFDSSMPITMVGIDANVRSAFFDQQDIDTILALGTAKAQFAINIQGTLNKYIQGLYNFNGFDLPDPLTMAVAIDPSCCKTEACAVHVIIGDGLGRGMTIIDKIGYYGEKNPVDVAIDVDRKRFLEILYKALS
ncbi:MAG TPA: nucleoside hydrolase [Anaerolineaceae bacterium]|nr:nucleoside hydrolase [Anaerolineaceae bacterium]